MASLGSCTNLGFEIDLRTWKSEWLWYSMVVDIWTREEFWSGSNAMVEENVGSVDALLCSFLMLLCMFAAYLTKKFHFIYLPESGTFSFCHCLSLQSLSQFWGPEISGWIDHEPMRGIDVGKLVIFNVLTTIQLPLELLHLHNMQRTHAHCPCCVCV